MAKDHGPQIKDDGEYEALRKARCQQGEGSADRQHQPQPGGQARRQIASLRGLEEGDLYQRAKEIGIEGRSGMSRANPRPSHPLSRSGYGAARAGARRPRDLTRPAAAGRRARPPRSWSGCCRSSP